MTLERSLFGGGLAPNAAGLFRSSFLANASCRWVYDTTGATLGLLIPPITAATNYRVRAIAEIGADAGSGMLTFFGDENPDDLRFAVTEDRKWCIDYKNKSIITNPGDAVDETIYLLEMQVNNKDFEVFVNGQSIGSDTASQRVTLLDLGLCGRRNGADTDQKIRGQMFAFQYKDLDTPANTQTWSLVKLQCWPPDGNTLNNTSGSNPLVQVNEPVADNWSNTTEVTQEL